jgi:DNA-binding FadR family transcriptional regulator
LLSLGLIEVRGGRGTFVAQTDEPFLNQAVMVSTLIGGRTANELYEVRSIVEPHIARLAAERATSTDLAEMRRCLDRQGEALDSIHEFLEADVAFHLAVARATQNRVLYQILRALRTLMMTRLATTLAAQPSNTGLRFREHTAVLEAIEQRDGEGAALAMAVHMRAFRHLIRSDDAPAGGG